MRYVFTRLVLSPDGILRAPFPTYELIAGPFGAQNFVLIAVSDEDFKGDDGAEIVGQTQKLSVWLAARGIPQARIDEAIARYGDPDVTVVVDAPTLARWKARIDKRYRERPGGYNIGVG